MSFIPTSRQEMQQRGWSELDIIFVSGDACIDHPAFGVPLLARWLESRNFRVGIISQPDWRSKEDFMALGRPLLFFGVSAGAMDSMVAHYTPARKLRHDDAYTPGNRHGKRPNRATVVYTSRLREAYSGTPVVIGGIEASLRRFAHYDFWEDRIRRSILFDSKADLLVYGMGERPLLEIATRMREGADISELADIRGTAFTCRADPSQLSGAGVEIPSFEEISSDRKKFAEAFNISAGEQNPFSGERIIQRHGVRLLVCNPPSLPLSEEEMDEIYALPFTKEPHPSCKEPVLAWEQIKTSITTHRGCFGGCAFCAIAMHQGKIVQSRSERSVLAEIDALVRKRWFRGSVSDLGGPTANMYSTGCGNEDALKKCRKSGCLFPKICKNLQCSENALLRLLMKSRERKGVRHLSISSGVRYDLLERQPGYFRELVSRHVGGQLKVAPEHLVEHVASLMRKPGPKVFESFLRRFASESERCGKRQYLVPYLISGHPGCRIQDMLELALKLKKLDIRVEQVQDFTPAPGTLSTCMFYTGTDPESGIPLHVPASDREKGLQKALLFWRVPEQKAKILEALKEAGVEKMASELIGNPPQRGVSSRRKVSMTVQEMQ